MDRQFLIEERLDEGRIVRITLNRVAVRNAQNRGLLVELDDALCAAEADDTVRVIILAGAGPMFSSGHDLGSDIALIEAGTGADRHATYDAYGGTRKAAERRMLQEWHFYYSNTMRWRNLRKITIAQVHGSVYAAALMLMWACDLIVAAEQTMFADVVGTRLGMCGLEYFGHPWEFGPRRAKELLLTGDSLSVDEAYRLGMVSKIFPADQLGEQTLDYAREIARRPTMAALLIKESVNQTMDNMGFSNALHACFSLHQVNHAHWAELHRDDSQHAIAYPEDGVEDWRAARPPGPASRGQRGSQSSSVRVSHE